MQKFYKISGLILMFVLVFMFMPGAYAQYTPAVLIVDQDIVDGQVTAARAVINGPGWLVIYADANGAPGPVLGYAALMPGINAHVTVPVDTTKVTDKLYAMLHMDAGKVGTYEFPGPDTPLMVNDAPVTPAFKITGTSLTLVRTAMLSNGFKTFVAAVKAAGLEKQLRGDGPFTVFAPTDAAFAALPKSDLNKLMADSSALKTLLLYHVVPGKVMSTDVKDGMKTATVQGAKVQFTLNNNKIMVNDAQITAKDLPAHNGVIHVIDKVLALPPDAQTGQRALASSTVTETATATTTVPLTETQAMTASNAVTTSNAVTASNTPTATTAATGPDIIETATQNGSFNTLVNAAKTAGVVDTLKGAGPFTLFAPTDAAFAALPPGLLNQLMADPAKLKEVLLYHVAAGKITSNEFSDRLLVKTEQGASIKFTVTGGKVQVNGANLIQTDIEASNGVIHAIDRVLIPPGMETITATAAMTGTTAVTNTAPMTGTTSMTGTESVTSTTSVTGAIPVTSTTSMTGTTWTTSTTSMTGTTSMTSTTSMTETQATPTEATATTTPTVEATATPELTATSVSTTTAGPPKQMPQTGGSFSSATNTLPVVVLVLMALAAAAFVTRQRPA